MTGGGVRDEAMLWVYALAKAGLLARALRLPLDFCRLHDVKICHQLVTEEHMLGLSEFAGVQTFTFT